MKYILNQHRRYRTITNKMMIEDLQKASKCIKSGWLTMKIYKKRGKFSPDTISKRYGSWNEALLKAGLKPGNIIFITDEMLFNNLKNVWDKLGRAPKKRDLKQPLSQFSDSTYYNRFGSLYDTLKTFTRVYKNGVYDEKAYRPRNKRREGKIRDGMRIKVFVRDKFRCKYCGASPVDDPKVKLNADHIIPRSKGGLNTMKNLQTLCDRCNRGKAVKVIKKV